VERSRVDLVILDLEMPRLDGLGVLEDLRAQMRTAVLPVIVLTAHHGESEEQAGSDALPRRPGTRRPQTRQQLTE
jgi:DNA-binding response OmpR family regulator